MNECAHGHTFDDIEQTKCACGSVTRLSREEFIGIITDHGACSPLCSRCTELLAHDATLRVEVERLRGLIENAEHAWDCFARAGIDRTFDDTRCDCFKSAAAALAKPPK